MHDEPGKYNGNLDFTYIFLIVSLKILKSISQKKKYLINQMMGQNETQSLKSFIIVHHYRVRPLLVVKIQM